MQEDRKAPVADARGDLGGEAGLRRFLRQAGAHDLGVQPDDEPARQVARPGILARQATDPRQSCRIDRLLRHGARVAADIVVARNHQQRGADQVEQRTGVGTIGGVVGMQDLDIAGVHDQIGPDLIVEMLGQQPESGSGGTAGRGQMGIGNLHDLHRNLFLDVSG